MKKLFFILTFAFCLPLINTQAQAFDCSQIQSIPSVEFSTSYGKLRYDTTKNNQQVTAIAGSYGIAEKGLFAAGLATINVNFEISINTLGKIYGENNICVIPTNINIYIGYSDPVIYISKNLTPETCKYNVVLRHEQTHQQINKNALDYFLPLIQDAIKKIIPTVKPLNVSNTEEIDIATTELTQTYNRKIAPLIEVFKNELLKEQSKLDNHENYQHEEEICNI